VKHLWATVLILSACGPGGDSQSAAADNVQDTSAVAAEPAPIAARDRVLGLLSLPQVFGTEVCQPFMPIDVALYEEAGSFKPIGRISVDRPWRFHPNGGCDGLAVKVHRADSTAADELPTLEFSYEAPGAIVLQRKEAWFRIRLAGGAAWIHATEQNVFHPLEELLAENLAYVANPDGAGLAAAPGADRSAAADLLTADRPVDVLQSQRVGDELWLRVAIQNRSLCEGEDPTTIAEGWLPAHTSSGEPIVWFYSRGC